jgi:CRP/FNR family transcriptional regulator, cyclic AMP receptor protein
LSDASVLDRPAVARPSPVAWPHAGWPGASFGARRTRDAVLALAERAALRASPWLGELPAPLRQEIEQQCEVRSLRSGAEGDPADTAGLLGIVSGAMALRLRRPGAAVLDYLPEGTWFLDPSVLAGGPPLLQLRAQGRTKIAVLAPQALREMLARYPAAAPALHALGFAGTRRVAPILEDLASLPLRTRLARCVLRLCDSFGRSEAEGTRIALALSQDEIAQMLRASRQSVNSQLKALEAEGALRIARELLVRRRAALEIAAA